jgi:hypothetical protein
MTLEPKIYPDPEIDREAKIVRGICGALLGVAAAAAAWFRFGGFGVLGSTALFAGFAGVCAIGSIRHGDSFWFGLLRRRR